MVAVKVAVPRRRLVDLEAAVDPSHPRPVVLAVAPSRQAGQHPNPPGPRQALAAKRLPGLTATVAVRRASSRLEICLPAGPLAAQREAVSMELRESIVSICSHSVYSIPILCSVYGSGYPGYYGRGVSGRNFPFVFWPLSFGNVGGPAYLYNNEVSSRLCFEIHSNTSCYIVRHPIKHLTPRRNRKHCRLPIQFHSHHLPHPLRQCHRRRPHRLHKLQLLEPPHKHRRCRGII